MQKLLAYLPQKKSYYSIKIPAQTNTLYQHIHFIRHISSRILVKVIKEEYLGGEAEDDKWREKMR